MGWNLRSRINFSAERSSSGPARHADRRLRRQRVAQEIPRGLRLSAHAVRVFDRYRGHGGILERQRAGFDGVPWRGDVPGLPPTGPINTLLIESVPVSLRARAMATSIFVIHLFGDFWSPVIVGNLADWGTRADNPGAGLQNALLILPAVFSLSVLSWGWLAFRQRRRP